MSAPPTLLWLRRDLRLGDHPALAAALARGGPVIPVFVEPSTEDVGAAGRRWLAESLDALDAELIARGSRLVRREGPAASALIALAAETGARAVCWTRGYQPESRWQSAAVRSAFDEHGIEAIECGGHLLVEPEQILKRDRSPYAVFTRFFDALLALGDPPHALPIPDGFPAPSSWPVSRCTGVGTSAPAPRDQGHCPGERGAMDRALRFMDRALAGYDRARDMLDEDGTSGLSPHLHFGEISPRQLWNLARDTARTSEPTRSGELERAWLRQLAWREFAHHVLYHHPRTVSEPLNARFAAFPWRDDAASFAAWREGRTGYPLVDAAMRQLAKTGSMHNRARMVAASFLTKHLLVPWQRGAAHFAEHLFDADLANNTFGWQWSAGCGADAAPYFRVFNPVLQGQRFDPEGRYVTRFLPELAGLEPRFVHAPWTAPPLVRPKGYPGPIVEHKAARTAALAAYDAMRAAAHSAGV